MTVVGTLANDLATCMGDCGDFCLSPRLDRLDDWLSDAGLLSPCDVVVVVDGGCGLTNLSPVERTLF